MRPAKPNRKNTGVVLLAFLLALALMGVALLGASEWWGMARQREAEAELLYLGDQYRKAIAHYYYSTPAAVKTFPTQLEDLIADPRFPVPVRHLRRLYADPITGGEFDLVLAGPNIVGVVSTSTKRPIRRKNFSSPYASFEEQESYNAWKFVFNPPQRARSTRTTQANPGNISAGGK